ncbi:MAG: hypothetical protein Q8P41_06525, partial [Pseudomonadota bacterium]|nr:hypothetical protein [Pseudomonadota bacterium]
MSGARIAEAFGRAVRESATLAIEWREEKRRRLFFFRAGALVLVQSNLKSESPERIAERMPDLDADGLRAAVAQVRVDEALGAVTGEVLLHPGAPAPAFEPHDAIALLWGASERLPRWPDETFPRVVAVHAPLLGRIPAGAEITRYLLELDGSRPVEDVLDFGPDEPRQIANALAVAQVLGALVASESAEVVLVRGSGAPSVVPAPAPAAAPAPAVASGARTAPREDVTVDDIADLIRGELHVEPPAATPAAAAAPT